MFRIVVRLSWLVLLPRGGIIHGALGWILMGRPKSVLIRCSRYSILGLFCVSRWAKTEQNQSHILDGR